MFELSSAGLSNRCQVSLKNEGSCRRKPKIFTISATLTKLIFYSLHVFLNSFVFLVLVKYRGIHNIWILLWNWVKLYGECVFFQFAFNSFSPIIKFKNKRVASGAINQYVSWTAEQVIFIRGQAPVFIINQVHYLLSFLIKVISHLCWYKATSEFFALFHKY